jgi:hypothetical protein
MVDQATKALAQARADGRDPAHGGAAGRKRSRSITERNREVKEWDEAHERPDPEVFRREILPDLQGIPLKRLAEATGLSNPYCSMIRRGAYTPHPRHWGALRSLGSQANQPESVG